MLKLASIGTVVLALVAACRGSTPSAPANALLAPGRHAIDDAGISLSFEVRGHGAPCIAIPGGPGFDAVYLHSDALEASFTTIYVDPIGTGASAKLPAGELYSTARDASSIETLRRALGLAKLCILGHSYGGAVALQYATTHPDRVRALILYSTTPTNDDEWTAQLTANLKALEHEPWFADAMHGVDLEDAAKTQAELDAAVRLELPLYFANFQRVRAEHEAIIDHAKVEYDVYKHREPSDVRHDYRPLLAKLHVPTLVIAGARDPINGAVPAGWIAKAMPSATIVVVPDSGHMVHLEQPEAFARAIAAFAKTLAAS